MMSCKSLLVTLMVLAALCSLAAAQFGYGGYGRGYGGYGGGYGGYGGYGRGFGGGYGGYGRGYGGYGRGRFLRLSHDFKNNNDLNAPLQSTGGRTCRRGRMSRSKIGRINYFLSFTH
uniref:Putative neuropeptide-like protein 31 n=1 Tax=Ixodes ricinus TaxID=34613 RepID=V5IJU6_IXORI